MEFAMEAQQLVAISLEGISRLTGEPLDHRSIRKNL